MQFSNQFVVHGIHITENLLHHKQADVCRILEQKGFSQDAEQTTKDATHFIPAAGSASDDRQTTIRFDDGGFVAEDGVSHSGE